MVEPGEYSFFRLAIQNNWMGIAYLMIDQGFDIIEAIEDAFKEKLFNLVLFLITKTSESKKLQQKLSDGKNLFHLLGKYGNSDQGLAMQIFQELKSREVPIKEIDNEKRTAFHYAAMEPTREVIKEMLKEGCSPSSEDNEGQTPFSYAVVNCPDEHYKEILGEMLGAGGKINYKFEAKV